MEAGSVSTYQIRFRMADGRDHGPWQFPSTTTVGQMKDRILAEYPAEKAPEPDGPVIPKTTGDLTLILAGKLVDNAKVVGDLRQQMGNPGPDAVVTFHLVIRPPAAAKAQAAMKAEEEAKVKGCGCTIL